jgi:hypothetical protein
MYPAHVQTDFLGRKVDELVLSDPLGFLDDFIASNTSIVHSNLLSFDCLFSKDSYTAFPLLIFPRNNLVNTWHL